ncbi:MAG TPA: caspase family protein [Candidatus Sericytochromatia bacterium]
MGFNRRTFLQQALLAFASLGVSETVLSLLGDKSLAVPILDRYFQALAQPGGRKLALLVGINQYPRSAALSGCVTDVELQRELLIHRFGFNASDVLTLTDSQATRADIETAFIEHLSNQAKAGDVVVFHFSGYGSQVKMSESQTDSLISLSNSLVPVDSLLPTKGAATANDLLEETLILLLRSLNTDQVTTVLDTSYTPHPNILQGNLRVRSCPNPPAESPNAGELAFQEQVLLRLKSSREQLKKQNPQLPGIVLAAASPTQPATEALWNGFSAGLFTYALTQHLWQATPATTVQISVSRAAGMVKQLAGKEQQPQLIGQKSLDAPLLAYYLPPDPSIGADGVVTAVEDNGKHVQIWLAGLPATVLEYYGSNSLLSLSPAKTAEPTLESEASVPVWAFKSPQLQLRSKEGLTARARIVSTTAENYPLEVGQLVREAVRVLPHNLGLTVALDVHLERIERVDATSAFAGIGAVSSVVVAGEQAADYLFGKVLETQAIESGEVLTHAGGYGLFYLASEPIRSTTGEAGEAVKSAVTRLTPKLKTLLAAKLLRLTANEGSSRLGIRASLERVAPPTVVMQRETLRASGAAPGVLEAKNKPYLMPGSGGAVPSLPIGTRVQYRLENYSGAEVYFMLLGFDAGGNAIALYKLRSLQDQPSDTKPPLVDAVIAPGNSLILPQSVVTADWVIPGPSGLAEVQLICSRAPFTKAIALLESSRRLKAESEQIRDLLNPLEVAQAVLQDLHASSATLATTSASALDSTNTVSDTYALDVNAWATLSFIYQVV